MVKTNRRNGVKDKKVKLGLYKVSRDVHETERVFKKVIHPTHGHNSIRLVDKDGIPLRPPNSAALSRLHSSYMLTPRGVPARKSTHSYSGQIAKEKMHNLVNTMDTTNSHEMASYASMHNYGLSSAGSSRHYIPSNLSSKKRTFGSGPPRSAKPMAKSASSERSRFLSVTPDEDSILDEDSDRWNGSPQGKRLEKEWAALSQCRALKRSSEIVSHRVDRMYFMTGNKLKLQQKYHVEDDELQHLKALSLSRASAKPSRKQRQEANKLSNNMKTIDEDDRIEKIQRKLSNIERRLSFIEESREEDETRRLYYNKKSGFIGHAPPPSTSSESGIMGDTLTDEDAMTDTVYKGVIEEDEMSVNSSVSSDSEQNRMLDRPVSKVEVTALSNKKTKPDNAGIQFWDIMSHDKSMSGTDTMMKLLQMYPDVHERTRRAWENSEFETANALTLGVPRKIREKKLKLAKRPKKGAAFPQGKLTACHLCNHTEPKAPPVKPAGSEKKQRFPVRKVRKQCPYKPPPVDCDCRQDPNRKKGPILTVQGTQLPLFEREYMSQRTRKGDVYRPDTSGTSSKTIKSHDSLSETGSQSDHVDGVLHNGVRKNSRSSREEKSKENTDPASNIMVSQKPLTPKPSSCKSPLQGWAGEGETKKTPSENGLINHKNDKSLHEDQVDGMETPKSNEYINGTAENVQDSKETEEVFQNNENKDSDNNAIDASKSNVSDNNDSNENNAIVDNGEVNQTVENTETTNNENGEVNVSGEVETEVRTENPVFVTQDEEEAEDQSVQQNGESDGSGEGQIENQEPKGEAIKTTKDEKEKYDTD